MSEEELETMLERASDLGAKKALADIGLSGPEAAHDINSLRELLQAYKSAKSTAGKTAITMLTAAFIGLLMAGLSAKFKIFGG